ncbi:MAG: mechanosensitive ion channel family protein [Desulforudis sp.]|jgi:small-conductance mechanosensitive channel|nr:MAG: mechanosensitive ion channel family protein [Desulforudis sp.]
MTLNMTQIELELIIIVLVHILAAGFLAWLASQAWSFILGRIAKKAGRDLNARLVTISTKPIMLLVFILTLQVAADRLARFPQWVGSPVFSWFEYASFMVGALAAALWLNAVVSTITDWYMTNIAHRTESNMDEVFLPLIRKILSVVIYFMAVTIILGHFGVEVTGLIATAGVASLAIALAAKETLSNMLAGFMLLADRPFREGDRIELSSGVRGDVLQIGIRSTRIMTRENLLVVIPNMELANSQVINHIFTDSRMRLRIAVGVAYGSDLHRVKAILSDVLEKNSYVLQDPPPVVYFTDFGESSLNLLIRCWIDDARDRTRATDSINMDINDAFDREGIEIPFPQRDLYIRSSRFRGPASGNIPD